MNIKQGYKQTEIGIIPEDWEVKQLKDIFKLKNGYGFSSVFFSDTGVIVITPGNFKLDGGLFFNLRNTTRYSGEYLPSMKFEKGDLLIVMTDLTPNCNLLGKPGFINTTEEIILHNQRIGKIILITNLVDRNYLYRFFLSESYAKRMKETATGSTVRHTSNASIYNTFIPIPPLKEQTAIATALSDIDALIGELDKLIAKKQGIKQATMQQLLTGKKRLAGFSGEWEETKLEKFALFYKGKGLAKNEIDIYGKNPCVHYGELFTQYAETITQTHSRTNLSGNLFLSKNNDVLMPTSDVTPNGLAKASCILKDDVILGGDILVIRTNSKEINGTFLSFVIRHSKEQIMQLVTGSTVYHLYASDMKNFIFLIPSLEEQTAITNILSDMDAEISQLEGRRAKMGELKQGMMQELLTGRIRLNTQDSTRC